MTVDYRSIARERRKTALNALKIRKHEAFGAQMTGMSLRATEERLFAKMQFTSQPFAGLLIQPLSNY